MVLLSWLENINNIGQFFWFSEPYFHSVAIASLVMPLHTFRILSGFHSNNTSHICYCSFNYLFIRVKILSIHNKNQVDFYDINFFDPLVLMANCFWQLLGNGGIFLFQNLTQCYCIVLQLYTNTMYQHVFKISILHMSTRVVIFAKKNSIPTTKHSQLNTQINSQLGLSWWLPHHPCTESFLTSCRNCRRSTLFIGPYQTITKTRQTAIQLV